MFVFGACINKQGNSEWRTVGVGGGESHNSEVKESEFALAALMPVTQQEESRLSESPAVTLAGLDRTTCKTTERKECPSESFRPATDQGLRCCSDHISLS